jgi:hypothetical protein
MPPRIDPDTQENALPWPKDGREAVGGYPHLPPSDRPNFEPPDTSYACLPHTSHELRYATRY